MKRLLLPGLDGTGDLFAPLVEQLDREVDCQVVSYSPSRCESISILADQVLASLPASGDFDEAADLHPIEAKLLQEAPRQKLDHVGDATSTAIESTVGARHREEAGRRHVCSEDLLLALLSRKPAINARDNEGKTVLSRGARSDIYQLLARSGATR